MFILYMQLLSIQYRIFDTEKNVLQRCEAYGRVAIDKEKQGQYNHAPDMLLLLLLNPTTIFSQSYHC